MIAGTQDIRDMKAQSAFSESRMALADALLDVVSPKRIFAVSFLGARERIRKLLDKYQRCLRQLGLLDPLRSVVDVGSPAALFMLIHSQLEFVLELLEEDVRGERTDRAYLEERIKLMSVAPLLATGIPFAIGFSKRALAKPVPIHYTNLLLDLREWREEEASIACSGKNVQLPGASAPLDYSFHEKSCLFQFPSAPSPCLHFNPVGYYCYSAEALTLGPIYNLKEDKSTYQIEWQGGSFQSTVELIEGAKAHIKQFAPGLVDEIDLFVRGIVMVPSLEGKSSGFSVSWEPGLIELAPYHLIAKRAGEGLETGNRLLELVVAGLLVHESRHQKHYYLVRCCEDTELVSSGHAGFIRQEFKEFLLSVPWPKGTKDLRKFFTLAISVGSELLFLEYVLRTRRLNGDSQDFIENRIKRKRKYLLPLLGQAELLRYTFSPEGEVLLKKLFRLFQYH